MLHRISRLLRRTTTRSRNRSRTVACFERLEQRQLLAVGCFSGSLEYSDQADYFANQSMNGLSRIEPQVIASQPFAFRPSNATLNATRASELSPEGESDPEGEHGDDLVAFAKALADTSTILYGANWHAETSQQRRIFEDGGKYLPYVNVTNADRSPNEIAIQNNITVYPTWVFPDGSRLTGTQSLATISQRSGVEIPSSARPYLSRLGNLSVGIGSPQHIPVDAYSPSGAPLSISVSSSNPSLVTAAVLSNNRSLKIETDFGDMVFQLFEDKAPRPTGRVIELAESGFYNGIIFHRVISGFMIQGGDPLGTGTGGSPLGTFDDQFHLDLQHNRSGVLSFAKAGDDTNNSQFFITAGPTRHLDFNHSVFGQLVEGEAVRDAINKTATGANDRPTNQVVMRQVTVFNDTENAMVLLKPTGTGTGTANITVTVSDGNGNETSRTFVATVVADSFNGGPFLDDIPVLQAVSGVPMTYTLTSKDQEGDPVEYAFARLDDQPYELDVHPTTGVINFTAPEQFVGQLEFLVGVRQTTPSSRSDQFDRQKITVEVNLPPIAFSLNPESDSGQSNSDRVTNATSLTFDVTGVRSGSRVNILSGNQVLATRTATGTSMQISVPVESLGEGSFAFSARRTDGGKVTNSAVLSVQLDRTAPVPIAPESFPEKIIAGNLMDVNLNHPEEGQGLRYGLQDAPAGMTISSAGGRVRWTPNTNQVGSVTFTVTLTDLAGNISTESQVTLRVVVPPVANPDSAHTLKNESVLISVLRNDTDGGGTISPSSLQVVTMPESGQVEVLSNGRIRYTPEAGFVGNVMLGYRVSDEMGLISNEAVVTVRVLNSRWQNPVTPLDVNGDGRVAAVDALQVINYLNSNQPRELTTSSLVSPPYVDVNGDERVSALDALLVINFLNDRSASGESDESNEVAEDPREWDWQFSPLDWNERRRRSLEF